MRLFVIGMFVCVLALPQFASATPKKGEVRWEIMHLAEKACRDASSDVRDTGEYRVMYDDRYMRLTIVNEEPLQRKYPGSRVSKVYRFGDECYVESGNLLVQVLDGTFGTAILEVRESTGSYGPNYCPEGVQVILPSSRWVRLLARQKEIDTALARRKCRDKKLKELVKDMRSRASVQHP